MAKIVFVAVLLVLSLATASGTSASGDLASGIPPALMGVLQSLATVLASLGESATGVHRSVLTKAVPTAKPLGSTATINAVLGGINASALWSHFPDTQSAVDASKKTVKTCCAKTSEGVLGALTQKPSLPDKISTTAYHISDGTDEVLAVKAPNDLTDNNVEGSVYTCSENPCS